MNEQITMRQDEIAQYQANILMYTAIVASTPSEWPSHLAHLKGVKNRHEEISKIESLEDVELLGDLWTHDDAAAAIRSETIEMKKAQAILTALEAQAAQQA